MLGSILVPGATGRLGRIVVRALLDQGQPVRALTRRPQVATSLFGQRLEIAEGDFAEPRSLDRALSSVDRILLLSPLSEWLIDHQVALVEAAERQGVRRVVKISGSSWTIESADRSIAGNAHRTVERRLVGGAIESVSIRPNAWTQASLPPQIARARSGQSIVTLCGDAAVSYVDARDIADVAIAQLLAEEISPDPLVLTGAEALDIRALADLLSVHVRRPVAWTSESPTRSWSLTFEQRTIAEFLALIGEGRAAPVTTTVERVLGRPPRSVADFLSEQLQDVAA